MIGKFADYLVKVKKIGKCGTALGYISQIRIHLESSYEGTILPFLVGDSYYSNLVGDTNLSSNTNTSMLTTSSTNNSTRSSNTNTNMPTTSSTNNDISSYFNNTNLSVSSSNNNYLPSVNVSNSSITNTNLTTSSSTRASKVTKKGVE